MKTTPRAPPREQSWLTVIGVPLALLVLAFATVAVVVIDWGEWVGDRVVQVTEDA